MKIIRCLSDKIEEELDDAASYIDLAMKWKQEHPATAKLFYELSTEEMGHMEELHSAVVRLITEYRSEHGEPPKEMQTLYDYLHDKHIKRATEIKVKQGMFQAE